MLDEEYDPQQIADYGVRAQPALAAAMRPQLKLAQAGLAAAVLAVVASAVALFTFPSFNDDGTGRRWAVAALVTSVVMLAICAVQYLAWVRAMAEWRGERDYDLTSWIRASWILHLVSYAVVVLGLWACIAASIAAGTTATAASLLAVALLFLIGAQVLGGVQYLRVSGPSGTIPSHLRRLAAEIERRR
jgi:heme/copper-type cytochrome/quinol oxidase subunit 4